MASEAKDPPSQDAEFDSALINRRQRRWVKLVVVIVATLLAVAHVVWPALAIDGTSLGLLGVAAALLLVDLDKLDIDKIEAFGVSASRRREIERAKEDLGSVRAEDVRVLTPSPPQGVFAGSGTFSSPNQDASASGSTAQFSEVSDLTPPVDKAERLLWAAEQIRIELIIIAGNGGYLPPGRAWSSYSATDLSIVLASKSVIPSDLQRAVRVVLENRNALVHGASVVRRVAVSASDLGLDTLLKLREIKRNYVRVAMGRVAVYSDNTMTSLLDSGAVMLDQLDNEGNRLSVQVFPTVSEYTAGRYVTWEWDLSHVIRRPGWFFDVQTQAAREAWTTSASFMGRPYPDEWGVQYRIGGPMTFEDLT